MCRPDRQNRISVHRRFTERFGFLKEDQVIHVVVDQLGDNEDHRSKAAGSGTDWWVFIIQGNLTWFSSFY